MMESHLDITKSIPQQKNHSEGENNEKQQQQQKSTPFSKELRPDKDLKLSNCNFKSNIESDIARDEELKKAGKLKFIRRYPFPDEKILVQLARRVYKETDKGETLTDFKMPDGWQLLTTAFNKDTSNCYFGAAYWNPNEQQIVVAHRGTALTSPGALWTDVRGILHNTYVAQINSAITFAYKIRVIVEEINNNNNQKGNIFLQLSFTGHSLGGWLAQITTLTTKYFGLENVNGTDLFVKTEGAGYHAHTVVFDSPGCKEMLSQIKRDFDVPYDKDRDSIFTSKLDITNYLSAPNLVNTCNSHIGTLYRVFVEDPPARTPYDFGTYTKKMHAIKRIEKVFLLDKINEAQKVIDWPLVHKGITERALEGLFEKLFPTTNLIPRALKVLKLFKLKGGETLPYSNIKNEYEYFHLLAKEIDDNNYNPNPTGGGGGGVDNNPGYCEIRYQVQKIDKNKCSMTTFSQAELDFLNKYQRLRDTPGKQLKDVFRRFGDEAQKIKDALKNFKRDETAKEICCESECELKKLIIYVKYMIKFYPEITDEIERMLKNDPVWFRVKEPLRPFIGRTTQLEQTGNLIKQGMVVITGLDGVGKSELTVKYVREHYGVDNSLIWIDAETEETQKKSFKQLHKEDLRLKSIDEDGEEKNIELIVKEVYQCLSVNPGKSVFIFDNAEKLSAIEKFLPLGLPNKPYVVITSYNSQEWESDRTEIKSMPLEDFDDEEAVEFVKTYLEITDDSQDMDINTLIRELFNFPLALQHAVTYIKIMQQEFARRRLEYKISNYLRTYGREPRKMLTIIPKKLDGNRTKGAFLTLKIIIDRIKDDEENGLKALDMLDIITYFAPNNIPEKIFLNELAAGDQEHLLLITRLLEKYSVVRVDEPKEGEEKKEDCDKCISHTLRVHGLVQQIRKFVVKEEQREEAILGRALRLLTEQLMDHSTSTKKKSDKDRDNKNNEIVVATVSSIHNIIEFYAPHVVSVWNHACEYKKLIEDFIVRRRTTDMYTTYFHFIANGSTCEIVKKIIYEIETNYPNDSNKVKKIINAKNNFGKECALHIAAENGKEEMVKLLVTKGADVNVKKQYGWTPLSLAVNNGHLNIVKYLIENGAEIGNQRTGNEFTEMHLASKNGYAQIVSLLLAKGADVKELKKKDGADKKSSKAIINVASVNAQDKRQYTPLHFAVKNNYLEIVQILLQDDRINVNAETEFKITPLHFAVKSGNPEAVKVLLEKGADVNAKNRPDAFTPLHLAVLDGNEKIITYLLEKSEIININATTTQGNTALHLAAKKGDLKVVKILIQHNADASTNNNDGKSASQLADENGHGQVKNFIIENNRGNK